MSSVGIPAWNAEGLIPPIDARNPTSPLRSPYRVSLTDLVLRFSTSRPRCNVLDGLLRYRAAMHAVGLVGGVQWLDGSFLEQIEVLEARPPNDIDVVTFFHLPAGLTQAAVQARNPALFNPANVKATFRVDGYVVNLGMPSERLIRASAYWYSVWSHRRSRAWKGYLEVTLDPADDAAARALLAASPSNGGAP